MTLTAPTRHPQCGTYAGWNHHRSAGERTCQDCRDSAAAYARERRRITGSLCGYQFPIDTPNGRDLTELPGLGTVIARGLRETA